LRRVEGFALVPSSTWVLADAACGFTVDSASFESFASAAFFLLMRFCQSERIL
jgi:hypothetical protein